MFIADIIQKSIGFYKAEISQDTGTSGFVLYSQKMTVRTVQRMRIFIISEGDTSKKMCLCIEILGFFGASKLHKEVKQEVNPKKWVQN